MKPQYSLHLKVQIKSYLLGLSRWIKTVYHAQVNSLT